MSLAELLIAQGSMPGRWLLDTIEVTLGIAFKGGDEAINTGSDLGRAWKRFPDVEVGGF